MTQAPGHLTVNRNDARTPAASERDFARFFEEVRRELRALPDIFLQRWRRGRDVITTSSGRTGLRFDELTVVDGSAGTTNLYLPRATPKDQGRKVQFVKKFADGAIDLIPTDSSLVNLEERIELITPVGLYEAWWDGTAWWLPSMGGSTSTAPRGALRQHGLEHDPIGLWQLDGDLLDSSGSGYTLTVETGTSGTERYTYIENLLGFHFDGSTALIYNVAEAALRITGNLTFECLWVLDDSSVAGTGAWISHEPNPGAIGENLNQNVLYSWSINTYPSLHWFHEHGAGVDDTFIQTKHSCPSRGQVVHAAVTRTSNVIQMYFEGVPHGPPSSALTAAAGGDLGRLRLGAYPSAADRSRCVMASAKLITSALTAAQIAAEYNRTVGPSHGFI